MFCDGSQERRPGENECSRARRARVRATMFPRKMRQTGQRQAAEGELERGHVHFSTFEPGGGVRGVDDGSDGRRVNKTQTPSFSAQRQPSPLAFLLHHHSHHIISQSPTTPPPHAQPSARTTTKPTITNHTQRLIVTTSYTTSSPPLLLLCSSCPAPSTERTDCLLSSPISHLGSWTTSLSSRHLSPPEVLAAVPNRNSRTASARHHPFPAQRISSFAHPQDLTLPRPGYPPPLC